MDKCFFIVGKREFIVRYYILLSRNPLILSGNRNLLSNYHKKENKSAAQFATNLIIDNTVLFTIIQL